MKMKATNTRRRQLLGIAHLGAAQLGFDDEFRRLLQEQATGHASCRDMSDRELLSWCWHLKKLGATIGIPAPMPSRAPWRPTATQMAEIERLALAFGWNGLEDPRFLIFMRRTTKIDAVRFLTKWQATALIVGLRRWLKRKSTHTGHEGEQADKKGGV